jgi:hypothetical protein
VARQSTCRPACSRSARAFAKGRLKTTRRRRGRGGASRCGPRCWRRSSSCRSARGLLFPASEGGDRDHVALARGSPALTAAGVEHRRIYDMRHIV